MQTQIQSRAVLARLSIGLPGFSRQDKPLTEKVQHSENMGKESGKWQKTLYPQAATEPLTKFQSEVRTWFNAATLIWPDEGWALLPTAKLFEFTEKMREFRSKFDAVKSTFLAGYDNYVNWARVQQNGTFDPANYPGADRIAGNFRFRTETRPIPDSGDYVGEVAALLGNSAQDVDDAVESAVKAARNDLWQRLVDPVRHLVNRLSDQDAKFKDSLVGNIKEIIDVIPALNVTGDQKLEAFRLEVNHLLAQVTPQALRDDKFTRKDVAEKADAILAKMSGYFV
jgi:hypothetical protein